MKRAVTNCPDCERQVGKTKAGKVVKHYVYVRVETETSVKAHCPGSGKDAAE